MITEVKAYPFPSPVTVCKGDTLHVSHQHKIVMTHEADFTATWTHSIMFTLNGQVNWLVGTQETIDWLRNQQNSEFRRPYTPEEQQTIMYGRGGF